MQRWLPLLLFAFAGALGWVLVFSSPGRAPEREAAPLEDEASEPHAALPVAPPVASAVPRTPSPKPPEPTSRAPAPPPPPQPEEPSVQPPRRPEPPEEPEPDPRAVLELPEHLQDKSEAEKRAYFENLKGHHEGMMAYARERVEQLLDSEDPDQRAEGFRLRRDLSDAQDQLDLIDDYLRKHPE